MKRLSKPASYPYSPIHQHYGFAAFQPDSESKFISIAQELKTKEPDCLITWFTTKESADVIPNNSYIDQIVILEGNAKSLEAEIPRLQAESWTRFFTQKQSPRILLGQLGSNGDCLYATILARQIKHDYPGCHLTWAVSSLCRGMVEGNPFVDEIWEFPLTHWNQIPATWWLLEQQAKARASRGEFDQVFLTQIAPANFQNFDGTVRSSIFRAYPKPITVPIQNILRLQSDEVEKVRRFAEQHKLLKRRHVILFECASKSSQSFVTPEYALDVAQRLLPYLPDCSIILSSHVQIPQTDERIVDGSAISLRENAELSKYCTLFVGCSSGVTQTVLTDWAEPLPMIQLLRGVTSVYASVAHDFEYWGHSSEQILEMTDSPPEQLAECVYVALTQGFSTARSQFHQQIPIDFNYYLFGMRTLLLQSRQYSKTAQTILHTVERYGWHEQLKVFVQTELIPQTGINAASPVSSEDFTQLLQQIISIIKVSAIVATSKLEESICGCLQDLVEQTLYKKGELEIIVIDTNSQPNQQKIVEEFQAKYQNISYIHIPESETLYNAWNHCIQAARGRYITNANIHDRHRPDALERMADYLDINSQTALVYADQLITTIADDTWAATPAYRCWRYPSFSYSELERHCIIGTQPMWRKSLHEKYGYFRSQLRCIGDYEFWLRIGKTEQIARMPEILGLNYFNQYSTSEILHQETVALLKEYGVSAQNVIRKNFVPITLSKPELNGLSYRVSISPQPLVSIIILCDRHTKFLTEAVESAIAQTYHNWEGLIINDGNDDNNNQVAKQLIETYRHKNICLFQKPNSGVISSRNLGVEQSLGQFILFLNADDRLSANFIAETLAVLMQQPNIGFVYTDSQMLGAKQNLISHGDFTPSRFLKTNQATVSSLFRKEIYNSVGGFNEFMEAGLEDWEFWSSAYEKGWQGYRAEQPLLYCRQHPGGSRLQNLQRNQSELSLQLAKIIKLHYKLYERREVVWAEQILRQHQSPLALHRQTPAELEQIKYLPISSIVQSIHRPFWSVMILVHNPNHNLEKTLRSVLAQVGADEIQIAVVDCSTHSDSETIVKQIGEGRVRFYRQANNVGVAANWSACIEKALGHWVHILHQDDIVLPGFYNHLRTGVEKEPNVGAAFCRHISMTDNDHWMELSPLERETPGILENWIERIAVQNQIQPSAIVVKRSVYETLGGFHPELNYALDWEMWKRVALYYPIWYEPQPLACYRQHDTLENSPQLRAGMDVADFRRAIEISELYLPPTIKNELSNKSRVNYALYALETARKMLNTGDTYGAISQIQAGLKCSDSPGVISAMGQLFTSEPALRLLASIISTLNPNQFSTPKTEENKSSQVEFDLSDNESFEFELGEINLIIFPDWQQPEEIVYADLEFAIRSVIKHPERNKIKLWIDNSNFSDEDANLVISDVILNLVMQEELDVAEEPAISLTGQLSKMQWRSLISKIQSRIILSYENQEAIAIGGGEIPAWQHSLQQNESSEFEFELGEINLIIFPDWQQPEEIVYADLEFAIRSVIKHPERNKIKLWIDNSNFSDEDANLVISDVILNLVMQEELDVAEEPAISLTGQLSKMQWRSLISKIQSRIILSHENQKTIDIGAREISVWQP